MRPQTLELLEVVKAKGFPEISTTEAVVMSEFSDRGEAYTPDIISIKYEDTGIGLQVWSDRVTYYFWEAFSGGVSVKMPFVSLDYTLAAYKKFEEWIYSDEDDDCPFEIDERFR